MNLHLLAGIAVILVLVAVSAYREALRNEPLGRMRIAPGKLPPSDDSEVAETDAIRR
ncbi:hypothetical protein [Paraburkholderia sp.]|uniref:hypothetical protein n=1 Tax=Paraburkholderia sp. TaxID=1926495 RepID=UPI0023A559B0|nr:hypothetical protein [Paraburkholderia sp.]MDE1184309.1 hypothetical protein [Paraburkholderia sp.]